MAQSLLIGHPYQGQIPTRPLYIFLLTVLHLIFGENYPNILMGQTLVLAMIPVVFYFLGKKLHSRVAGVIIALLFIFRELTSWSHRTPRLKYELCWWFADLLLLIFACYFAIRWLRKRIRRVLIAGGSFGLLLLCVPNPCWCCHLLLAAPLSWAGNQNLSIFLQLSSYLVFW
jgi:hypothetical protein